MNILNNEYLKVNTKTLKIRLNSLKAHQILLKITVNVPNLFNFFINNVNKSELT